MLQVTVALCNFVFCFCFSPLTHSFCSSSNNNNERYANIENIYPRQINDDDEANKKNEPTTRIMKQRKENIPRLYSVYVVLLCCSSSQTNSSKRCDGEEKKYTALNRLRSPFELNMFLVNISSLVAARSRIPIDGLVCVYGSYGSMWLCVCESVNDRMHFSWYHT